MQILCSSWVEDFLPSEDTWSTFLPLYLFHTLSLSRISFLPFCLYFFRAHLSTSVTPPLESCLHAGCDLALCCPTALVVCITLKASGTDCPVLIICMNQWVPEGQEACFIHLPDCILWIEVRPQTFVNIRDKKEFGETWKRPLLPNILLYLIWSLYFDCLPHNYFSLITISVHRHAFPHLSGCKSQGYLLLEYLENNNPRWGVSDGRSQCPAHPSPISLRQSAFN